MIERFTWSEDDLMYEYEMSRHTRRVIPKPPFGRASYPGFSDGLGSLDEEEALNLQQTQIPWDNLLFEQAQVLRHVVDWYIDQIISGGILIPAVAYRHPNNQRILVVSNGTTRIKALDEIVHRYQTPIALADRRNVIIAVKTVVPLVPSRLYHIKDVKVIK